MKIKLLLIVVACSISSCISTKKLQKKLNAEKIEINTLHSRPKSDLEKKLDISLEIIDTLKFNDTEVLKNKKNVIPLIVVNIHHLDYQIKLGQNNLTDKLSNTFYKEFVKETKRSGNFNLKPSSNYIMKIYFNKIDFQTKFIEDFFGFWSFTITNRKLIPEKALIELNVSLHDKKTRKVIFEKKYVENNFAKSVGDEEMMSNKDLTKTILNKFNTTLNEKLEKLIHRIIKDINEVNQTLANRVDVSARK